MPTLEQQEIFALKGRISQLEARLEFLYKHLDVKFVEDSRATDDPKVVAALKANDVVKAIQLVRASTNVSLPEAQLAVEEMRSRLGL
jgi:UDP-N-acetylmuramoylalanine-D-glutamate ligase